MDNEKEQIFWRPMEDERVVQETIHYKKVFTGEIGVSFGQYPKGTSWIKILVRFKHVSCLPKDGGFLVGDSFSVKSLGTVYPARNPLKSDHLELLISRLCMHAGNIGSASLQDFSYDILVWAIKNDSQLAESVREWYPRTVSCIRDEE